MKVRSDIRGKVRIRLEFNTRSQTDMLVNIFVAHAHRVEQATVTALLREQLLAKT